VMLGNTQRQGRVRLGEKAGRGQSWAEIHFQFVEAYR
jgi:hypothetical protein